MRHFSTILLSLALSASMQVQAEKTMKAPQGGKQISDELLGIFFEDISMSADGGLCAELIQNGNFEYSPTERDGWGPSTGWLVTRHGHSTGRVDHSQDQPLNENNRNFMRIFTDRIGHYSDYKGWTGIGIRNGGFDDGIRLERGAKYTFSAFFRSDNEKKVRLVLESSNRILADDSLTIEGGGKWKKYSCTLKSSTTIDDAFLQVLSLSTGTLDVDMISLIPEDTYHGHGLRRDLAEALEALHPKFMRFPGGCIVHGGGEGFWNTYRWKNTVGPKEERIGQKNCWGYHQSYGLGYYEYFQLCEDLGMQPVPILPSGTSCQGAGGGWGLPGHTQSAWPMEDMDVWVNDALDLIEWANGDKSTRWGKVRADAGHPEPFGLKYLGIGNEEYISPAFCERFRYIYKKIKEAHPEIVIIGTAGVASHPGTEDYGPGWKLAEELEIPLLDEHYYENAEYFLHNRQYDAYPRDRKTKVYLGEYASGAKKFINALGEALYLIHVERNGDVVSMTSYAPLFARKGTNCWNPNLIYFDNQRPYLTCSYFVQQFFGISSGQYYYGDCINLKYEDKEKDELLEQSVILNVKTGELFLKMCNATDKLAKASIDLSRFSHLPQTAELKRLIGQPNDENGFEGEPIQPLTSTIDIQKKMEMNIPPYSFSLISLKGQK